MYVSGQALEVLDRIARETGRSRAEVVAEAVTRYAEQHEVLDRLERIETLLQEGVRVADPARNVLSARDGGTDADRTLAGMRAWAHPDDD